MRVPYWVRGTEQAEIIEYARRPNGVTQRLRLTTLGGSVGTPADGLTAKVLVVNSFAELERRAAEARGRIVVFDVAFDQSLADNGQAGVAYSQAGIYRRQGPVAAARVGAVAALVRSVGGANYRLPHTGQTAYDERVQKIPAAAVAAEDSMLLARLAMRGDVTVKLLLTPQLLPDVETFNVIADLPGMERPEEIVLISGHLDSWDVGTGAIDDAAGVAAAMGVAHVFQQLKVRPKRTLRVVAWMNEESNGRGSQAYLQAHRAQLDKHAAVIESDLGAGRVLGLESYVTPAGAIKLQALVPILQPLGATAIVRSTTPVSSDIQQMQLAGVPGFEPLLDISHYFDYHHTDADTLDKVDPANLRRMVAALGVLAYYLTDQSQMLDRVPRQ